MCGNGGQTGGQTGGGAVNAVNGVAPGADGNVRLTADNVGAALRALNVQSVTKQYRRFLAQEGNEDVTPKDYLWALGKGSFFLRAADGVYFVSCVDVADGLKARIYAMIPPTSANDGDVIDGGVYINNTKLAAFGSTEDLQELIFKIGNSPVATEAYVRSCIYCADYNITEFAELLPVYAAGAQMRAKMHLSGGAVLEVPLAQVRFENNAPAEFIFAGTGSITIQSGVIAANVSHVLFDRVFCAIDAGGWSNAEEGSKTEVTLEYADANVDIIKSLIDAGFEVSIIDKEIIGCMLQTGKLRYVSEENFMFPLIIKSVPVTFGYLFTGVGVTNHHYADDETGYDLVPEPRIVYAYFSKDTTTSPATKSKTHGQYPLSTKEYVNASISNIWKDITEEWDSYREEHDEVDFASAARAFIKTLDDGRYTFSGEDAVIHTHLITAGGSNAAQYRVIWFALPNGNAPNFEYWKDNTRILGTTSPDGVLRLSVLGKTVVYKDEFSAALAGLPSRESVENAIRTEVRDVTSTYDQLSVVRTRLQKFANMKHTIRVEIENARMLLDEEDVILQLWVCSRKHGTAHHWWHPSQPGSPTKTSPIGYALIAGDLIYQNRPLETARFPAVPAWMPNDGYVLTEIPVTHQDLVNGYVDIDCSKYFLPMIKPKSTQWRYKDVSLMFTQRAKNEYDRHSVPVTWTVGVLRDGQYKTIGSYFNAAKIGITRGCNQTIVDGTSSRSKMIKHLYISVG